MVRNVAILIFDDVEVLDFTGPYEVFAVSRDMNSPRDPLFRVYTVADEKRPIIARNGLSVNPDYSIDDCPAPDLMLIPGGQGTRTSIHNPRLIGWIQKYAESAEQILSVCTGAFMLARAGLLRGLNATTYHTAFDMLKELEPEVTLCPGERWVDNGDIVTSAGVSAGIDMSLHIVRKLHGEAQAEFTANHMEYEHWKSVR